jgi:pimeloyl-ACP methyl ester carboxylesterase
MTEGAGAMGAAPYSDVFYPAADGLSLHARDYAGPGSALAPVLCLPGLTRNVRDFDGVAPVLAGRRRVVVAEQRGRGQSAWDPNPANYAPPVYVRDMGSLLDHLQIPKIVIVGTSLGGLMGMIMAATMKRRVAGLVLNDVGPELSPDGIRRIQQAVARQAEIGGWADAVAELSRIHAETFADYAAADWERMARAIYRDGPENRPVADYDPAISIGVAATPMPPPDLWPVFAAIADTPILVLRGAVSDILSAATVETMLRRHPLLGAVEVPLRGHAPTLDEPVALAALTGFLAGLGGAA